MFLLIAFTTLFLALQLEIRHKVFKAKGVFTFAPGKTRIARTFGLRARGFYSAPELSGENLILLLLCEDDLFFEHRGFNRREMMNRIRAFLRGEGITGGSSISQQIVKILFLSRAPRILRKILEVPYTLWLEAIFTKEEILSLYISNVCLGINVFGVREASFIYFGKDANELSYLEALFLFLAIPSPIKVLTEISVNQSVRGVDFRKAYWKIKDFYRILYVMNAAPSVEGTRLNYEEAKTWMSQISKYDPRLACNVEQERLISLQALVVLRDFVRVARTFPHRTPEQVRSCRDTFPCEYTELLEAGAARLKTAAPRRRGTAPYIDWEYLIRLASWHGMILPLWNNLSQNGIELPREVESRLKHEVEIRMVRAMQLKKKMELLGDDFKKRAPSVLFIKGLALGMLVGSDEVARDPGDLDLLVRESELSALFETMRENGFSPLLNHTEAQKTQLLDRGEGIVFTNSEGLHVDVHTRLGGPFGPVFSENYPYEHVSELPGGFRTLSAELSVFFLALHGLKHKWSRLGWLFSYSKLVEKQGLISWDRVFEEARRLHLVRPVLLANRLAQEFFEIQIPDHSIRDSFRGLNSLADDFAFRYFESELRKTLKDFGRCIHSLDTTSQRISYLWSKIFLLGSSDTVDSEGSMRNMFPFILKGSRFLRR